MEKKNKNKKEKKKLSKKKIKYLVFIIVFILSTIILIILCNKILGNIKQRKSFENSVLSFAEKNEKTIFSINKIIFFSSSDAKNKVSSASNFTIENLYTFTDIAIFINNNSEENTLENTLKELKIENIKFTKNPQIGEPKLFFKSINNFAKSDIEEENKIENELNFQISSENEVDLTKPVLYNNCANPITISYINTNIKTDYTMIDTENPITYNGSLLKRCGVSINSIQTSISFDIKIANNKNQKFATTVYIDIPYEDGEKSIYDGNLTVKKETNFNFYRYE